MLDGAWSGELEGETNLHKWILKLHVKRKFITFSKCLCKKTSKCIFVIVFGSLCKKVEDRSTHRAAFEFSWQTREYTGAADQIVRCAKLSQFTDFKEKQPQSNQSFSAYTSRYITAWPIVITTFGNDFHVKLVFVCKVCLHLQTAVSSGLCISSERWNVTFYK